MTKKEPQATATKILANKYPKARAAFLAGSVVRGDHTETSDLDLVVIFDTLPQAYRESFVFGGWPVEAFVHDPQTLRYFFYEVDRPTGVPSLAMMVKEGLELLQCNELSVSLKQLADTVIDAGPPLWGEKERQTSRYVITDLVDDMRAPRSRDELIASAARLHPLLADHYLRSQQLWSARGKSIPRRLCSVSTDFAEIFGEAFRAIFEEGNATKVIRLCEDVLRPSGGRLFDGYIMHAPESWR
ncbi:MAG: nucleotidyltransferase domain-containing protein [Gammaproteobacteria bacterium]|nr:nucleotidyltransferase domain-containing protein [Gammaproteobacteria bacterium]